MENPVERVDPFLEGLDEEKFVAVSLSNCDEEPIINRALDTDTSKRMYHSSFV